MTALSDVLLAEARFLQRDYEAQRGDTAERRIAAALIEALRHVPEARDGTS